MPRILPGVTEPGGYVAGRRFALEGVNYDSGEEIPAAVVARCRNRDSLLSRRWIIPVSETLAKNAKHPRHLTTPTPTSMHHSEVRQHLEADGG